MSDNIKLVDFQRPKKLEPVPSVVEMLSDYLAMAKAGKITGIAMALLTNDASTITAITIGPNQRPMLLLGATTHLSHRLNITLDAQPGAPIDYEPVAPVANESDPVKIEITENGVAPHAPSED